jgi:hypothetical protein
MLPGDRIRLVEFVLKAGVVFLIVGIILRVLQYLVD